MNTTASTHHPPQLWSELRREPHLDNLHLTTWFRQTNEFMKYYNSLDWPILAFSHPTLIPVNIVSCDGGRWALLSMRNSYYNRLSRQAFTTSSTYLLYLLSNVPLTSQFFARSFHDTLWRSKDIYNQIQITYESYRPLMTTFHIPVLK